LITSPMLRNSFHHRGVTVVLPGEPTSTGGYIYDRRAFEALERRGWYVDYINLPARFPFPDSITLNAADAALARLARRTTVVIDGLALGAMPAVVARHQHRLTIVGLVHHPLCLETGLDPATADRLHASEGEALATCRHVLVTSPLTATTLMRDFAVPEARITVAVPGVDPAPLAEDNGNALKLLCVGTLTPRKGHKVLLEALASLLDLQWELTCIGSPDLHPPTAANVRVATEALGLVDRVRLMGEVEPKVLATSYIKANLFVSASFYEGYGMALADALAHGLPIVATAGGATAETVPPDAGFLVPPGNVRALSDALRHVLTEPTIRERMHTGAMRARLLLPRWEDTAAAIEHALLAQNQ
jgi:glycosyltransferase involved in cell wall biosynthesis